MMLKDLHQKDITKKHINKKNKNPVNNNLATVIISRTFTSNKNK
jgi:hypothetical protein